MKKLLAFFLLFSLAACATPEQIAQREAMQAEADMETCRSYGLRPGSEAFGNCRLQLDLARQQQYNNYYAYPPRPYIGTGFYYVR